jgi:hypothetical protein
MALARRWAPVAVIALVAAACGDDASPGTSAPSTTAAAVTTSAPAETTTTTEPEPENPLDILAGMDFSGPGSPDGTGSIGSPDYATASAITADLVAAGVDLTGITLWVLPVVGTADRLLVVEITDAATGLEDDASDGVLGALAEAPSLDGSRIARLVINYHGADARGDFVLTTTVPMEAFIAFVTEGADPEGLFELQLTRGGTVVDQ